MTNARTVAFPLLALALALAARFPAQAQSVVSTHSGLIHFFVGSVFIGDDPLEEKFGRFPDIGEGHELRTALGRAEVLLTPGVFLRLDENSSIRMITTRFSDTQVELLGGSAILEVVEKVPDTAVNLIYKNWRIRVPELGVYRIDTSQPRIRAYSGEVDVEADGKIEIVREGGVFPLAGVLHVDPSPTFGADDFKEWAMSRSESISMDNTIAAGIVDDPSQMAGSVPATGGYSYFPSMGNTSLGVGSPYGVSFWSPYQSTLMSIYFSPYSYGPLYRGWPSRHWPYPGQPPFTSQGGQWLYPSRTFLLPPSGTHLPRTIPPRISVAAPRAYTPAARPSGALSPHVGMPGGAHH